MTTLQTPVEIAVGEVASFPAPVEIHMYSRGSLFGIASQDRGDLLIKGIAGFTYVKVVAA